VARHWRVANHAPSPRGYLLLAVTHVCDVASSGLTLNEDAGSEHASRTRHFRHSTKAAPPLSTQICILMSNPRHRNLMLDMPLEDR
jgi:hypothetical protein